MHWLEPIIGVLPGSWLEGGLLALTVVVYIVARAAYQRSRAHPLLIPILTSVAVMVAVLLASDISYERYTGSTQILSLLIGPATVALAIPLYTHLPQLKRMWLPVTVALIVGGVVAFLSALAIGFMFGASPELIISMAPKSATMPVSIPASEAVGGIGALVAVSVAATGIVGVLIAAPLFRLVGADDPITQGFTLGLTSHAIGTARSVYINSAAAGSAALAMGLNSLLTAALMPFLPFILRIFGA